MTAAVGGHLSLMSCVREPSQDNGSELECDRNGGSKKKFWNPRKWFKRKSNKVAEDITSGTDPPDTFHSTKDTIRSLSTSELSISEEPVKRKNSSGVPLHPGLSVSHDSVFHSPHSGSESELDGAQSSSSLIFHHQPILPDTRLQSELSERLRSRRGRCDTSEDDEGLPRSPCNSPTTADILDKATIKDHPTKSHSTCSDGSLLSMGSSEMDEDSYGQQSRHSSKLSLHDKRTAYDIGPDLELGISNVSAPLNHSAAHHKVAVRPKRTHGAPRRKKATPLTSGTVLPTTPEVNEDTSVRSITPEVVTTTREIVTEHYTSVSKSTSKVRSLNGSSMLSETQLKCSSLPPGLAGPGLSANRLNRSKSNAGSKSQDPLEEDDECYEEKKKEESFFGRFFGRQSAKKKKSKEETNVKITNVQSTTVRQSENLSVVVAKAVEDRRPYSVDPFMIRTGGLIKTGPASRQRMQPIDIPASPEFDRQQQRSPDLQMLPPKSPEKPYATTPYHSELEHHFRQRSVVPPTSPQEPLNFVTSLPPTATTTPVSPNIPLSHSVSPPKSLWSESTKVRYFESRIEDNKSKVKIAGLSSLQQRVMSHNDNDDTDDTGFKSLTDFPFEPETKKPNVTKSHSFKSVIKHANDTKKSCVVAPMPAKRNISVEEMNMDSLSSVDTVSRDVDSYETIVRPEVVENVPNSSSLSLDSSIGSFEENENVNVVERTKRSASNESVYSNHSSLKHFKTETINKVTADHVSNSEITISYGGPQSVLNPPVQHTSIVNIGAQEIVNIYENIKIKTPTEKLAPKEPPQVVTKIEVKRENSAVPEFLNVHLNKVDSKPITTVVLSTAPSVTSPIIVEEKMKVKVEPKVSNDDSTKRKFSTDDMEIIDKDTTEEVVEVPSKNITPPSTNRMYKKHSETGNQFIAHQRKSSLVVVSNSTPETPSSPTKPFLKKKSNSLEVVDAIKKTQSETNGDEKPIRNGLDKSESVGNVKERCSPSADEAPVEVILRRKSLAKQRQDDEPELMKVFARRSLKLKDTDIEAFSQQVIMAVQDAEAADKLNSNRSRDSDKENDAVESPPEERRKSVGTKEAPKIKEPLVETKVVEVSEVILRKQSGNNKFAFPRTVSLTNPKTNDNLDKFHKQNSLNERPKTEMSPNDKLPNKTWINTVKQKDVEIMEDEKIQMKGDITDIAPKSDFINEDFPVKTKNFNQRKAEWEQRAQQALKKNTP